MLLRSFRTHYLRHITTYIAITLSCYFLAQTSKQLHNAFYLFALLPTLLILNKQLLQNLFRSTVFKILLAFGVWHIASITWSDAPNIDNAKDVLYVVLFVIAIAIAWQNRDHRHPHTLIISSLITCLPILYLLFTSDHSVRLKGGPGIFSNPITAANSLVFLIITNVYLASNEKRKAHILVYALAALLHFYVFTLCQSRGSLAALLAGAAVLLCFRFAKARQLKIFATCSIITAGLIATYAMHKNWLAIPTAGPQKVTYHIPKELDITSVQANPIVSNNVQNQEILSLQSGLMKADGNKIKLDQQTRSITITLATPTFKPYSQFELIAQDKKGRSFPLPISPPRILDFDTTFGDRLDIWAGFYKVIEQKPLIGHGASHQQSVMTDSRKTPYYDPHNVFVGTALSSGGIGLFIHIILLVFTARELMRKSPGHSLFLALFAAGLTATMLDDPSFFDSPLPYWLLVLIPIGYAISKQTFQTEKPT
ncbi:O-antigen ligase family protein [Aestuariicella sp. G3-2]|uniref:O-antigen ligase family protein n=1 Tax=Pseudomaricurvus albidus TaxID=2842452 RepID=UPI001C0C5984|nr:O-antigen ligase family protein [Aestuariicella albida]MBU3068991.1 O-antigen ligase family protein [Aestuariicella albida]